MLFRLSLSDIFTVLAIVAIGVTSVGYADNEGTEKLLRDDGYTEINIIGRKFVGCSSSMTFYRTAFEATNSRGIRIKGIACRGLLSDGIVIHRR